MFGPPPGIGILPGIPPIAPIPAPIPWFIPPCIILDAAAMFSGVIILWSNWGLESKARIYGLASTIARSCGFCWTIISMNAGSLISCWTIGLFIIWFIWAGFIPPAIPYIPVRPPPVCMFGIPPIPPNPPPIPPPIPPNPPKLPGIPTFVLGLVDDGCCAVL